MAEAKFWIDLGWLMGLEPTTTRITIYPQKPGFMRASGLFGGKLSLEFRW
jgi:hypothetical protein